MAGRLRLARRLFYAALVLAGSAFDARGQDAVLLSSTAPGQTPGMAITLGQGFTVPDGAIAVLLLRSGDVLKIEGPFHGTPQAPHAGSRAGSFLEELRHSQLTDQVFAATRGRPPGAYSASAHEDVVVDVEDTATYCIDTSSSVRLRRVPTIDWPRGVRRVGGSRVISWRANEPELPWPAELAVADGDRLEILDDVGAVRSVLTFRQLSILPSESAWTAQAMLLGCSKQAAPKLRELTRNVTVPALYLASDRGRDPIYRIGDPLKIVVQSNVDGYLYCFVRQGDGSTVPLFPSRASGGARIDAHVPLQIPGRRLAAGISVSAPLGVDEIDCYLADHDLRAKLPSAILDQNFTPLPDAVARDLKAVFRPAHGSSIAMASLFVRVEAKRQ
jgi:hypothetical protein